MCLVRSLDQQRYSIENNVIGLKWDSSCASGRFASPITVPNLSWAGHCSSVSSISLNMSKRDWTKLLGMFFMSILSKPSGPRAALGLNLLTALYHMSQSKAGHWNWTLGRNAWVNWTIRVQSSSEICESRFHLSDQCCVKVVNTSLTSVMKILCTISSSTSKTCGNCTSQSAPSDAFTLIAFPSWNHKESKCWTMSRSSISWCVFTSMAKIWYFSSFQMWSMLAVGSSRKSM